MVVLVTLIALIGLTISVVTLVLLLMFLYKVPRYLDKIADALQLANRISFQHYEDSFKE